MPRILKDFWIKAVSDAGLVEAVIATLGVIDKDGDVTLPGFFGSQEVAMLPAHDWRSVPIGKGILSEEGNQAIARMQMNLDIEDGRKWHSALKFDIAHGKPLQQWSYGFDLFEGGGKCGEFNGKQVRFLGPVNGGPGCTAWEVSPVLVGAGENTRTLGVKSDGLKFCDEADAALASVESFIVRAVSLAELRQKDGRGLSATNQERLKGLCERIAVAQTSLSALMVDGDALRKEMRAELGRALKSGL